MPLIAVFVYFLRRARGAILGWGLTLALLGWYMLSFYDTLAAQQETLEALVAQYPPELMVFFGGAAEMFTPAGYLNLEFFSYMPLILGIYAVLLGSGMLAGDEENGTLDLLLAQPIHRTTLWAGRLLSVGAILALILLFTWVGFVIGERQTSLGIRPLEMLRPFLSFFAVLFLFAAMAFFLSMVLPSRNLAATLGALLVFVSYFVHSLAQLDENLRPLARYLPLHYYQGGQALNGLKGDWLAILFGVGLAFALLGWLFFLRRDIRLTGERSWKWGFLLKMAKQNWDK